MNKIINLLRTKLYRPAIAPDHIYREELIVKLSEGITKPATLVSAPAGYGKSQLISSWVETMGIPCAWISLSAEESKVSAFLTYLFHGIDKLFPGKLEQTKDYSLAISTPPIQQVSHTLINELDLIKEDFVLVLDDYHLIDSATVHQLIQEILNYPPQQIHIVIITRKDPPLSINNLRFYNRLSEIRMQDLAFDVPEIIILYERLKGIRLMENTAKRLAESTEGWITGLRLIALAYLDIKTEDELLLYLENDPKWFSEYLFDEVFVKQTPERQEMLIALSLFDRYSVGLLSAIMVEQNFEGNSDFINWLIQTNMFIIPLDHKQEWYRYHHFFRDLLNKQAIKTLDPEAIKAFHKRASKWFEKQGLIGEAIEHSIAGNDVNYSLSIFERHRAIELENDRWYNLEQWLEYIPENVQKSSVSIQATKAWVYYQQTRIETMAEVIEFINSNLNISSENEELQGELDFFKGVIAYFSGQIDVSLLSLYSSIQKLRNRIGVILGEAELIYSLALQMNGDLKEGISVLKDCIKRSMSTDLMYLTRIQAGINFINVLAADFVSARYWSKPMKKIMNKSGSDYALSWGEYLDAFVEFNCYNLDHALQQFESSISRKFISDMSISINSYTGAILCLVLMNKPEESRKYLDNMLEYIESMEDPIHLTMIHSFQARLDLLKGDSESAMVWAKQSDFSIDPLSIFLWVEVLPITKARILVSSDNSSDQSIAVELLEEVRSAVSAVHIKCHDLDILLLLSVGYYKLNLQEKWQTHLMKAIEIAQPQNWLRPFVEIGKQLLEMIDMLPKKDKHISFLGLLSKTISTNDQQFTTTNQKKILLQKEDKELVDLTAREIETIEWLLNGLRNKEIAEKMFISVDAVKKNLYRIFLKLNVKSRIELVNKAKKLGLNSKEEAK